MIRCMLGRVLFLACLTLWLVGVPSQSRMNAEGQGFPGNDFSGINSQEPVVWPPPIDLKLERGLMADVVSRRRVVNTSNRVKSIRDRSSIDSTRGIILYNILSPDLHSDISRGIASRHKSKTVGGDWTSSIFAEISTEGLSVGDSFLSQGVTRISVYFPVNPDVGRRKLASVLNIERGCEPSWSTDRYGRSGVDTNNTDPRTRLRRKAGVVSQKYWSVYPLCWPVANKQRPETHRPRSRRE